MIEIHVTYKIICKAVEQAKKNKQEKTVVLPVIDSDIAEPMMIFIDDINYEQ